MNNWVGRIILFLIVGGGCFLSIRYSTSHFKSDRQLILLNTTRPDFRKLLNVEKQNPGVLSRGSLREYFDYFHLVTQAMPDNSDGMLMLGYLDEVTGDRQGAQDHLTKAYHMDPSFFFTEFNLALVLFEKGDYSKSAELLQSALTISPEMTLGRMMNSIIYRQFFSSMNDSRDIIVDLRQSYNEAYVLLIESKAFLSKAGGIGPSDNESPQVHARIM